MTTKENKEKQISRICAKLQIKLISKGWKEKDRKRWDIVISKLQKIRQ
jgi:hypothetical protein